MTKTILTGADQPQKTSPGPQRSVEVAFSDFQAFLNNLRKPSGQGPVPENALFNGLAFGTLGRMILPLLRKDLSQSDLCRLFLDRLIDIANPALCYISLFNPEKEEVFLIYSKSEPRGERLFQSLIFGKGFSPDCVWEHLMGNGEDQINQTPSMVFWPDLLCEKEAGVSNSMTVEVKTNGEFLGCVFLADIPSGQFEAAVPFVKYLAELLGLSTRNRRVNRELQKSETLFRTLFEEMHVGYALAEVEVDQTHQPRELRIFLHNNRFRELFSLPPLNGNHPRLRDLPAFNESDLLEEFSQLALKGGELNTELHCTSLDKSFEVKSFSPKVGLLALMVNDVTEKARLQRDLAEKDRYMKTLLANLPGIAYRCKNDPDWTMEFISNGCLDLTGYPATDLIGNRLLSFNEIILPEYREEVWNSWQSTLRDRSVFVGEYQIKTREGQIKWVWERGCGVFATTGELLALEGFIIDISEQKRAHS